MYTALKLKSVLYWVSAFPSRRRVIRELKPLPITIPKSHQQSRNQAIMQAVTKQQAQQNNIPPCRNSIWYRKTNMISQANKGEQVFPCSLSRGVFLLFLSSCRTQLGYQNRAINFSLGQAAERPIEVCQSVQGRRKRIGLSLDVRTRTQASTHYHDEG